MAHAAAQARSAPLGATMPAAAASARLYYVQWLRVLLIALVVGQHAAEPYVVTGGDWMVSDPASSTALLVPFVLNGTFFMGFFFLISGYFLDASLDRHGAARVIGDRLLRLGVPLVLIVGIVNGAIGWAIYGEDMGYPAFLLTTYLPGAPEFGPLWFIAHLLVYILVYALWRGIFAGEARWLRAPKAPGHRAIFIFVLGLGAVTALIRIRYPIDDWVRIGGLIPAEPARLPQYIGLFVVGILAGRGRWFEEIDGRVAAIWFAIGAVTFAATAALALDRLALPDYLGLRIAWGFLEAPVGVGMILGLTVLLRHCCARTGPWLRRLEGSVYGVYLFHVYFVIGLQAALTGFGWPGLVKWAVVTLAALALSFGFATLLRRIPGAQRIL
ncbi:MAG: acyltransferase [Maritimibacter sp.]|nr:acyltransferase [Maritimibacter sp.]